MTKEELAQRIKQKYPDYQNIPDIELANRILAKYPEYRDQVTEPTTTTTMPSKQAEPTRRMVFSLMAFFIAFTSA